MPKPEECSHTFVGSKSCAKCGWTPSAADLAHPALLNLLLAAEAAEAYEQTPDDAWSDAEFEEHTDRLKTATAAARKAVDRGQ
jgi:hypothetical protein